MIHSILSHQLHILILLYQWYQCNSNTKCLWNMLSTSCIIFYVIYVLRSLAIWGESNALLTLSSIYGLTKCSTVRSWWITFDALHLCIPFIRNITVFSTDTSIQCTALSSVCCWCTHIRYWYFRNLSNSVDLISWTVCVCALMCSLLASRTCNWRSNTAKSNEIALTTPDRLIAM